MFRINSKNAVWDDGETPFGRAMNKLNIPGICGNTRSGKGAVLSMHI
ncbi:hypothetical protein Q3H59_004166 [Pantoea sp. SORGH_AS 659]|nr:hypothetical protein [Pantoea sp. SORGH_AS_0659]